MKKFAVEASRYENELKSESARIARSDLVPLGML